MNKYRIYDKLNKEYVTDTQYGNFVIEMDGSLAFHDTSGNNYPPSYRLLDPTRYLIEWCTGLVDCNHKEIFVGDIVSILEFYETPEMTSTNYIEWAVIFKFGMFTLENKNCQAEYGSSTLLQEYHSYDNNFTITGNIHAQTPTT